MIDEVYADAADAADMVDAADADADAALYYDD